MANKSANGRGTIRKRPDGRWEARLTLSVDQKTGKQKQRSFYGKTQKEVKDKLTAAIKDRDDGISIETPAKLTLKDWLEKWLDVYCISIKPNTLYSYKKQVDNWIIPHLGAVKLTGLNHAAVQKFVNTISSGEKPLAPKSVKNCFAVLNSALSRAVQNDMIRKNPCTYIELPRMEKKSIMPLNESETKKFLEAVSGHANETLFRVALFTGMRQGELMGLKWNDIDFKKGTIRVERQLIHGKVAGTGYSLATTKTDAVRIIRPAPMVMSWLKSWKLEQAKRRFQLGRQWGDEFTDLVFTDPMGKHLCHSTLTHEARRFGDKIGKAGFRFHDLRHTYAVMCIRAGDDIKTISANLGHKTISVTMDIYAAYTIDMAIASANRMDQYMANIGVG